MPFRFESLEIWHRARVFSAHVDQLVKNFPPHELYGLRSQMTRAANATSLLIAEGAGLQTKQLFHHRVSLAIGETSEVVAASFLALDRGYVTKATHTETYEHADALCRKIALFRQTLL